MLRRALFQLHWLLGISAGTVLAVVGATGALLSFQDPLLRWMNPGVMTIEPGTPSAPAPEAALARVRAAFPDKRLVSVTLSDDPRHAARVLFAAPRETRYINPYTGEATGTPRGTGFFQAMTQLHRRLAAGDVGKHVVGASTVALAMLCLSGLYLRWWRKRPGSMRYFHATAGTWILAIYLLVALTGLYWSYGWYRDALFALAGAARPAAQRSAGTIELRYLEPDAPHERAYSRVVLDEATGAVLRRERYAGLPAGARFMRSIFALHSGSFFGAPGIVLVMLASLAMPFFAITGWLLYLRRRPEKKHKRHYFSTREISCDRGSGARSQR
jgi:sulfite reductase (NADPH) flavoprotein alpha-component